MRMILNRIIPLLRPLLVITFIIIVWLDFIILPVIHAYRGDTPYTAYTTAEWWLGMGSVVVTWIISRHKEKLSQSQK